MDSFETWLESSTNAPSARKTSTWVLELMKPETSLEKAGLLGKDENAGKIEGSGKRRIPNLRCIDSKKPWESTGAEQGCGGQALWASLIPGVAWSQSQLNGMKHTLGHLSLFS